MSNSPKLVVPLMVTVAVALLCMTSSCAATPAPAVECIQLRSKAVELSATPAFGGRVLSFNLRGQPNVLKVGAAVEQQPAPEVSAASGDIAYFGHDVWVGPQSQWWLHQQLNHERQAAAAVWPPDPYLSLAQTHLARRSHDALEFEGVPSPLTGVQLRKQIQLSAGRADTVEIQASARNMRTEAIAWDLWFNTRVAATTRVFVPVAAAGDIRVQPPSEAGTTAPRFKRGRGVFALRADAGQDGLIQRGKLLLQPSAGWMAGFAGGQVLLIRFAHQPLAAIHPEQGQVELYLDTPPRHPEQGLLEMEVHAPYRQLAPGAQMQAQEQWTLLRYTGPDEEQAQRQFLCSQAKALALANACDAPSAPR
ncbi:DUF4380 domain-containing protein [Xanthomonas oryzae pv. oryzicola]|uniref:DUF4380 domain-containing protein n=1 Tax=Xanthomonas oryzae TaxID=347 RepID=UPI00096F61E4|nr:DUF4380 domain-containing protein [Xanthomonas oryzae]MEC5080729.1 DUF4380 domain-containing protein [Xanthomonas oryzae pv. oryzicola]MEC5113156.1 DUF4380 domain-containing protein [Xanthomonas oryzae pv. oryzicola]OWB30823.1 hypothetical protein XocBAI15_01285 [Xanthomonas oryzae pv. oryzicola]OWB33026.1 hypothetical protein XocBAI21_04100 [Xanthomonas oryzae pv. oryzicola]QEO95046.1 hypothetical protein XOCgx_0050 [Xanthomonas oryzae pv. oryzicola]